ncbi:MAG: RidA family protein [Nannocystales bacterium]
MSHPSTRSLEYGPIFAWSKQHDGLIYTSGHAAVGVEDLKFTYGDFVHEARATFQNLQRTLEKAGSSLKNVIKVTCYMTDLGNFGLFNQVYTEFFDVEAPPVRTCVEVRRLPYDFKLEVEVVASA